MRHLQDIAALLNTLIQSNNFHALIIQSPAGWAKSTTIDRLLREKAISFRTLGCYSTPLGFYNALCETTEQILLIDDCAGLFTDPIAVSLLKASTWPSGGSADRLIKWSSTSEKVKKPETVFNGKLVLLTNTIQRGHEMRAFLSRTLYLKIEFSSEEIKELLSQAAHELSYYEDTQCALMVANYLGEQTSFRDTSNINLRTLQLGYELAKTHPENWQNLLEKLLPGKRPDAYAKELSETQLCVQEQAKEFMRVTGLSRRTFFNYRERMA